MRQTRAWQDHLAQLHFHLSANSSAAAPPSSSHATPQDTHTPFGPPILILSLTSFTPPFPFPFPFPSPFPFWFWFWFWEAAPLQYCCPIGHGLLNGTSWNSPLPVLAFPFPLTLEVSLSTSFVVNMGAGRLMSPQPEFFQPVDLRKIPGWKADMRIRARAIVQASNSMNVA